MQRISRADRRPKQNHKEENLLALYQELFSLKEELDWYWTREIFFLRAWGIEESNFSSTSFTTNASRRRRSGSFLENERKYSESIPTIYSLVFLLFRKSTTKYWVNGTTRFLQYLARIFENDFHEFNLFCYRLIVYSWRRSTVTDGRCEDNTSNDPFSRWKSVQ